MSDQRGQQSEALADDIEAGGRELLPGLDGIVRGALADAVGTYAWRRPGWEPPDSAADPWVQLIQARVVCRAPAQGPDPGDLVVDVVAEVDDRLVHVPVGLRGSPGPVPVPGFEVEDAALGFIDGPVAGLSSAMAFDAMAVGSTVAAVVNTLLAGADVSGDLVRGVLVDGTSTAVAIDDRYAFTVFNALVAGGRPATDVVIALDHVGFNHLAAPMALWRHDDWDLGLVQESLVGASNGSSLVVASVRDLLSSGGPPAEAGADFVSEARRLGLMAARMHLAFADAYGRLPSEPAVWGDMPVSTVVRTHGDFTVHRVWRSDQGWFVGDFGPGGDPNAAAGSGSARTQLHEGVYYRPALADLAEMGWSLRAIASSVAAERDPDGHLDTRPLIRAWVQRNRAGLLAGYLEAPGIEALLPSTTDDRAALLAWFEAERASRNGL